MDHHPVISANITFTIRRSSFDQAINRLSQIYLGELCIADDASTDPVFWTNSGNLHNKISA